LEKIETLSHRLTTMEVMRLNIRALLLRTWWAYLLMLATVVGFVAVQQDNTARILTILIGLAGMVLPILRTAMNTLKAQALIRTGRKILIQDGYLEIETDDGAESRAPLKDFLSAARFGPYFVIYVARTSILPIPFRAFKTKHDLAAFETELRAHGLLK